MPASGSILGNAVRRREDPGILRGSTRYFDDLQLPGLAHVAFVRSTIAHARVTGVDTSDAKAMPGVAGVYAAGDLDLAPVQGFVMLPPAFARPPLATDVVRFVGDIVAVVVAETRAQAMDAAEAVIVDYDPLPVVVDPEAALEDGSPLVHEEYGTNQVFEWSLAGGDVEAAFAGSDVVVEKRIVNHRTAGAAIEPRGVLADWREGKLTFWSATQIPHITRVILSIQLGISEDTLRRAKNRGELRAKKQRNKDGQPSQGKELYIVADLKDWLDNLPDA